MNDVTTLVIFFSVCSLMVNLLVLQHIGTVLDKITRLENRVFGNDDTHHVV